MTDDRSGRRGHADYGSTFWFAYAANAFLVTAASLLARYAEFVHFYQPDHPELWLGWIVGLGMVGSLAFRLLQGRGIDRYGPRLIWLGCGLLFIISALAHLFITRMDTPAVFLARVVMSSSLAGVFGSSMVYISRRASPERMAEIIGTLGTSGFVGMIIGPALGDWVFSSRETTLDEIQTMFLVAAGLAVGSVVFAALATRKEVARTARRTSPPTWWLVQRYFPGSILVVGITMGVVLVIPQVFLADFVKHLGLSNLSSFFSVYAISAFTTRLSIRRFPERYGIIPMAVVGLLAAAISCLLLVPVSQSWHLIFPAVVLGVAHAFLFPAVVAGGSGFFPERHRGVATAVMLMTLDTGILIGGPLIGALVYSAKLMGWPPYLTVFLTLASMCLLVTGFYLTTARRPSHHRRVVTERTAPSQPELTPASRLEAEKHAADHEPASPSPRA